MNKDCTQHNLLQHQETEKLQNHRTSKRGWKTIHPQPHTQSTACFPPSTPSEGLRMAACKTASDLRWAKSVSEDSATIPEGAWMQMEVAQEKEADVQEAARYRFTKEFHRFAWRDCWFEDESTFSTGSVDKMVLDLSRTNQDRVDSPKLTDRQNKISLSVAAAISASGKSPLFFLPKNWTKHKIYTVYKTQLIPHITKKKRKRIVLVHDNDGRHGTAKMKEMLNEKISRVVHLPPNSPDLNPIENVWAWMKNKIEKRDVKTEEELRREIERYWKKVPHPMIVNLITSIPQRLAQVRSRKGKRTQY
jgi:hypothetical protein